MYHFWLQFMVHYRKNDYHLFNLNANTEKDGIFESVKNYNIYLYYVKNIIFE